MPGLSGKSSSSSVEITGIFCYPIKSCAGGAARSVTIDALGLRYDRKWMLVDSAGRFMTQREYPEMTQIAPSISAEYDALLIRRDGTPDLRVPLTGPPRAAREVTVFQFTGMAEDEGDTAAEWFSARLGLDCRLVRAGAAWDRPVTLPPARPVDRVGFADDYPTMLTSESSLADLNARLRARHVEKVPMSRFRPNIVVADAGDGLRPWAEDGWRTLRLMSGAVLNVAYTCARCGMITIDQQTAERRGPEPLRTLSEFRRVEGGRVLFGVYLTADAPCELSVGDHLAIE